jgi:serine/threonine protein kinase
VHGDIKPQNIALGSFHQPGFLIHIIDFGSTFPYMVEGHHIKDVPPDTPAQVSLFYASIRGQEQARMQHTSTITKAWALTINHMTELSRRDDLELLMYVILELYLGPLPWDTPETRISGKAAKRAVYDAKRSFLTMGDLLDVPEVIQEAISTAQALGFEDAPDYELLQAMFTLFDRMGRNGKYLISVYITTGSVLETRP